MKNSKLIMSGFLNALGIFAYIVGISFIMRNGDKIFGRMNNFLAPAAFLLLFVLSAAITGALALGRPVVLYFENFKREAVKLFFYTTGWLLAITIIIFAILLFK